MEDETPQTEPEVAKAKQRHPGSENLIPYKPGQSGNPSGRPKGTISISNYLQQLLAENEGKLARELAEKIIANAMADSQFTKIALDRNDGAVLQKSLGLEVPMPPGMPSDDAPIEDFHKAYEDFGGGTIAVISLDENGESADPRFKRVTE